MALRIFVVIRASKEATESLCTEIIERVVPCESRAVISESPFSKAVKKTFELGIESGSKWTLAVDADVLLTDSAIVELIELAESLPASFFRIEGMVLDRFFGFPRKGGAHLYRTEYLRKALQLTDQVADTLRPESRVVKEMVKLGYHSYQGDQVYGIHDYFQYYRDVFRKTFVYAQKHKHLIPYFNQYWAEMQAENPEFEIALLGLQAGLNAPTNSLPNVDALYALYDSYQKGNGQNYFGPSEISGKGVSEIIQSHKVPQYAARYAHAAQAINRTDIVTKDTLFKRIIKRVVSKINR